MNLFLDRNWNQDVIPYPDPAIEIVDASFKDLVLSNAGLERIHTGSRWTEGPCWFGDGRYLIWSDIPNNRMLRWLEETGTVTIFRDDSKYSNGNTRDLQGRLITCEHGTRSVTRTEYDGTKTVLADSYEGKRLNSPNDVVVHENGDIWFTDPGYGILMDYEGNKSSFELPTNVYRLNITSNCLTAVTSELERPNGLCFSPDFSRLYITDTGVSHKPNHPRQIFVFDVDHNKQLINKRVFCDLKNAIADGIRCDLNGNVWASAGWAENCTNQIRIYSPEGDLIGRIHLPEPVSNLCFGGLKRNRLFITASQSVYSLYVNVQGA